MLTASCVAALTLISERVGAERWGARGAPPRSAMAVFEHLGDGRRATSRRAAGQ